MNNHNLLSWDKDARQELDTPAKNDFAQSLKAVHSHQVHRKHVQKVFDRYLHSQTLNN